MDSEKNELGVDPLTKQIVNHVYFVNNINSPVDLDCSYPLMKIKIKIGNKSFHCLCDSGASVSILSSKALADVDEKLVEKCDDIIQLSSATGEDIKVLGRFKIPVSLKGKTTFNHIFNIVNNIKFDAVIGMDFIRQHGVIIDGSKGHFSYFDGEKKHNILATILMSIDRNTGVTLYINHLDNNKRKLLSDILWKNEDVFAKDMTEIGCCNLVELTIDDDDVPVYVKPYKIALTQQPIVKEYIQQMLDNNIIRPSTSPYCSPLLLLKKRNKESGIQGYRVVVDFRALNARCRRQYIHTFRLSEIFSKLNGAIYFSTVDCFSGFWQNPIKEEHKFKSCFQTTEGCFEFNRSPFGIANAGIVFQRCMNIVLKEAIGNYAIPYCDDVICYSRTFEEHLKHLELLFDAFRKAGLKIKLNKCNFIKDELIYLGFIVGRYGVRPNPEKVAAIAKFPKPRNLKELKSAIGLFSFYRMFIRKFADIAHPLIMLTRKTTRWNWSEECDRAFNILKNKLITPPILAFPDVNKDYILDCDASLVAVGGILHQLQNVRIPSDDDDDDEARWEVREVIIATTSRHLTDVESRYAICELESLALHHCLHAFYEYVYGRHIVVRTDNSVVKNIMTVKHPKGRNDRFAAYFQKFDLEIQHRKGCHSQNVDALSRMPAESINLITASKLPGPDGWIRSQKSDSYCQKLRNQIKEEYARKGIFQPVERNELLKFKNKIVVPKEFKWALIERFHDTDLSCHAGLEKVLDKIQQDYYWPKLYKDCKFYIDSCLHCAQHKPYGGRKAPLRPIPSPRNKFYSISSDIKGPLAESARGYRYCLIFICNLTKYCELCKIKDQKTTTIARQFIKRIVLRYGSPCHFHSDMGQTYLSKLMNKICQELSILKTHTTAMRPQANGGCEYVCKRMGSQLAATLKQSHRSWPELLPFIQFSFNTSIQSSTKARPHYLMYGEDAIEPDCISKRKGKTNIINKEHDLFYLKWREALENARKCLQEAKEKQKFYYDKNKYIRTFRINDQVMMKNLLLTNKAAPKWIGPFTVTGIKGPVNYSVRAKNEKTEQIVHVDRLKLFPRREEEIKLTLEREKEANIAEAAAPQSVRVNHYRPAESVTSPSREGKDTSTTESSVVNRLVAPSGETTRSTTPIENQYSVSRDALSLPRKEGRGIVNKNHYIPSIENNRYIPPTQKRRGRKKNQYSENTAHDDEREFSIKAGRSTTARYSLRNRIKRPDRYGNPIYY